MNDRKNHKKRLQDARNLQICLWVILILIQMAVVNCLDISADASAITGDGAEEKELTIKSDIYTKEEECKVLTKTYTNPQGAVYGRKRWGIVPVTVSFPKSSVEEMVIYEAVEGMTPIPDTLEVTMREDGQQVQVVCLLKEKWIMKEEWKDDFSFPVTFHTYDAGYYLLGDRMIPHNDQRPGLDGYEELLLDMIGADREEYRIMNIRWAGGAYWDEDGILCRDAVASGQKLVRDYGVKYGTEVEFPAYEGWKTVTVSGLPERETDVHENDIGQVPRPQEAEETESAGENQEPSVDWWEKITGTLFVIIGIGTLLFLGGLALLGIRKLVKMWKEWYNRST